MVNRKQPDPAAAEEHFDRTLSQLLKQVEAEPVSKELAELALQLKLAVEARNRNSH
ncbi:hypothetical protein [Pararhodobacter sp.]|uniref:hypothetical protein n=1 Tax=Pararhodobacter sp. TaxID=2127056 RepID=UPI002FE1A5F2|nr:hypothetical protein [Pseudomonadota bacterium]